MLPRGKNSIAASNRLAREGRRVQFQNTWELCVALMHIAASVSSSPEQCGVISGVEGGRLVENRVWTRAVWGQPCVRGMCSCLQETTSEGDEPP